jgi:uncharacterized membrane protein YgdD (TMEM256/DUF423 family)
MNMARAALTAAAVLGFLGVALGAFGAHALRARISEAQLAIYHTGVEYLFYHALALLAVAAIATHEAIPLRATIGCWVLGSVIFAGTLCALAVTGQRWLGAVTPIGGVLLALGWICLLWGSWSSWLAGR